MRLLLFLLLPALGFAQTGFRAEFNYLVPDTPVEGGDYRLRGLYADGDALGFPVDSVTAGKFFYDAKGRLYEIVYSNAAQPLTIEVDTVGHSFAPTLGIGLLTDRTVNIFLPFETSKIAGKLRSIVEVETRKLIDFNSVLEVDKLADLLDVDTTGLGNSYIVRYVADSAKWYVFENNIDGLTDGFKWNNNLYLGTNPAFLDKTGTSSGNIGIGPSALATVNGATHNVGIGVFAGRYSSGGENVAIGYGALGIDGLGGQNIVIGIGAQGRSAWGVPEDTPNYTSTYRSVIIGKAARTKQRNSDHEIVIGASSVGNGIGTATIGSSYTNATFLKGALNISGYGQGNREAGDTILVDNNVTIKTRSPYLAAFATDGTLIEVDTTGLFGGVSGGASDLASLSDVDTTGQSTGSTLLYDATSGNWEAQANSIDNLTDGYKAGLDNLILGREPFPGYNGARNIIITTNGIDSLRSPDGYSVGMVIIGDNAYDKAKAGSANSVVIGSSAMTNSTGGEDMVVIGGDAGKNLSTGSGVYIGSKAGRNLSGSVELTRYNTIIGAGAQEGGTNVSEAVIIGNTAYAPSNTINSIVIGSGTIVPGQYISNIGKGSNSAKLGNERIDSTFLYGNLVLPEYGAGNKEASDLSKTGSGYFLEVATDGTLIESQVTGDVQLTDLSVLVNSAGSANLEYDTTTGVFTYTPPDLSSYLTSEVDGSTTNEIQDLSLTGNTLSLSGDATTVDLSGYLDDQTVSLTGAGITAISGTYPNFTITSTEVDGSTTNELQTLSFNDATRQLTLSDDGTIDLSEGIQDEIAATLVQGEGISLTYDDGAGTLTIAAPSGAGNTDEQTLSINSATAELSISNGNTVDLSEAIDAQVNTLFVDGTNIQSTYDDGANTLTVRTTDALTQIDAITFDNNVTDAVTGRLQYDQDKGTLKFGLANNTPIYLGTDMGWYVKNQSGSSIAKGTPVYVSGTDGSSGRKLISPMIADGSINAKLFLGITAETIANGGDGLVLDHGGIKGVNLSGFSANDVLYVSPTVAGTLVNTEPTAPNLKLPIGYVVNNASNGSLSIRSTVGTYLSENHDVQIASATNGDVLKFDGSKWVDGTDLVDDADADATNEIQTISLVGNDLTLSNSGGTVTLPSYTSESTTASNGLTLSGSDVRLGGTLTDPTQIVLDENEFQIIEFSGINFHLRPNLENGTISLGANKTRITNDVIFEAYADGNKEAGDLSKTPSDYKAAFATDGTIIEVSNIDAMVVACSDETTDITTGTAKVTFRAPHAMTITGVRASLTTASSSGNPTVDINEGGTSILGTKLTIDANEKTSTTAATPATITDDTIADDAEITIDIDAAGTGATGLKVTILYRKN